MTKKKADQKPKIIAIMNVSNHAIWTDQGRLAKGDIGKCGVEAANKLIERGSGEQVIDGPPDVPTDE